MPRLVRDESPCQDLGHSRQDGIFWLVYHSWRMLYSYLFQVTMAHLRYNLKMDHQHHHHHQVLGPTTTGTVPCIYQTRARTESGWNGTLVGMEDE
jgi:hypothetical protein